MSILKIGLNLTPDNIERLAKAIARLERDGQLVDRRTQIKRELARAATITNQNGEELVRTAVTTPIVRGVKSLTRIIREGLHSYVDDLRLQLMLNKERRIQRKIVVRRLITERKDIDRIGQANTRYQRQQTRELARSHRKGQSEYAKLIPDIDAYLQSRDNERIRKLNQAHRFLEESRIRFSGPYGHLERQKMYDGLIPEVDTYLQRNDNARIQQASRIQSIVERTRRTLKHNEQQRAYDALIPDIDTYLQKKDNERITESNVRNKFLEEIGIRFPGSYGHAERQRMYNESIPDIDAYLQERDNERIALLNKVHKFNKERTNMVGHEIQQQKYDELTPEVDTYLQQKDNARIALENEKFKENSSIERAAESSETQEYYDSIAQNIDSMEAQVTARDNTRIAMQNKKFILEGEELQAAEHAVKQDYLDDNFEFCLSGHLHHKLHANA